MLKHIILLSILLFSFYVKAQEKYDYQWIMGNLPNEPFQKSGGVILDFNNAANNASYTNLGTPSLDALSSICDKTGNLLFYSNKCRILNKEHQIVRNGDSLNLGFYYDTYCEGYGYPASALFLPTPNDTNLFTFFHLRIDDMSSWSTKLLMTTLDKRGDNGLGEVLEKNRLVLRDTFHEELEAIRHGNGRDWWILTPKVTFTDNVIPSGTMIRFLLTPDGVQGPFYQKMTHSVRAVTNDQACFSPDGRYYIRSGGQFNVFVYHVDRCTGLLDLKTRWERPQEPTAFSIATGVAVSPDSKKLYVSTVTRLLQFDLEADDIWGSQKVIHTFSPVPGGTSIFQMQLAPDGKIYGIAMGSTTYMHVIEQPNNTGDACSFKPYSFELPVKQWVYLPNFPTYNVFDLQGSVCDTICENRPGRNGLYTNADAIEVSPNPAGEVLKFKLPFCPCGHWQVFNVAGVLMHEFSANAQDGPRYELDVSTWPSGVYMIRGKNTEHYYFAKKFVVVH